MDTRKRVTVVSHTHWDRAWYCTFQEFRVRLVRLVDRLIDLLDGDPRFAVFMLDGQTAILEDYLEVRPERKERLQALARAGRISVGPWYVLPDEFLVSPESLVRNLCLGLRMAAELGGELRAGYVPDGFGHVAQLPQILRGFDMDSAFFWRGMGVEGDRLGTEFQWKAPDGSAVTAIFMPWGYHNLSNLGYVIRWGDTSQMEFDRPLALRQIRKAIGDLERFARARAFLLMNGIDHAEPEPRLPELLEAARAELPDADIRQGTVLDHLRAVRDSGIDLPSFTGELRWGRYSEVLQGVYSTRMPLKQRNHRVENLLERYTEPLHALAWLSGGRPPEGTPGLILTAWKWLLKNHPHDDIYGSGIDQVHLEMEHRFDQAEQIGAVIVRDSVRLLGRRIDCSGEQGHPVLLYNPLNWERRETVVADIDFDFDDPLAGRFSLVDHCGAPMASQILGSREEVWLEPLKPNRKRRVSVAFAARVPSCGYTLAYARDAAGPAAARSGAWTWSDRGAENDVLRFQVQADGSIELHDKRTGVTYHDLHRFEDVEDAGDEYSSSPCARPERVSSQALAARVERIAEGPCLARFKVRLSLPVPASLLPDRSARSPARVAIPIESVVTIRRDSPLLEIRTTVENAARDHKLSVCFPTPYEPETVQVDEAFAVVDRPVDLPRAEGWVEDPTPLMHQRTFIDLSGAGHGLAVVNRGLPSVEVVRKPEAKTRGTVVSLTLLRCVGWLSRDDLPTRRVAAGPLLETPGAQCLGRHVFEYAVLPHPGDWRLAAPLAWAFGAPILAARADSHEGMVLREMPFIGVDPDHAERTIRPIAWPRGGPLPPERALLVTEPAGLLLSSLHRSGTGDSIIARLYNPDTKRGGTYRIACSFPLAAAHLVSLEEKRRATLPVRSGGELTLDVPPGGVVTLELVPIAPGDGASDR